VSSVWPDIPAATSSGRKVRDQLDYIVWISDVKEPAGFHGGADQEDWRRRSQIAYTSLVDAMAPGHGDPLPPDVPPAVRPGTWPDVPSGAVPGMTVRHQLAVIRAIATTSRTNRLFPHSAQEVVAWTTRVQSAFDALDHGRALPMPDAARTAPPVPTQSSKPRLAKARPAKARPAAAKAAPRKRAAGRTASVATRASSKPARAKRRRRG
jgi:hypothetical protein